MLRRIGSIKCFALMMVLVLSSSFMPFLFLVAGADDGVGTFDLETYEMLHEDVFLDDTIRTLGKEMPSNFITHEHIDRFQSVIDNISMPFIPFTASDEEKWDILHELTVPIFALLNEILVTEFIDDDLVFLFESVDIVIQNVFYHPFLENIVLEIYRDDESVTLGVGFNVCLDTFELFRANPYNRVALQEWHIICPWNVTAKAATVRGVAYYFIRNDLMVFVSDDKFYTRTSVQFMDPRLVASVVTRDFWIRDNGTRTPSVWFEMIVTHITPSGGLLGSLATRILHSVWQ